MSNNKDEHSFIITVFAVIGAAMLVFVLFIGAVLAFVAFGLTIAAIFAWNKPLHIGKLVIEPEEARAFVQRGVIGAWMVPAFMVFCALLFGLRINWDYLVHFIIAGYVGGSLGLEILFAQQEQSSGGMANVTNQPVIPSPPPQQALPRPEPQPFRYASWDDEEERGQ